MPVGLFRFSEVLDEPVSPFRSEVDERGTAVASPTWGSVVANSSDELISRRHLSFFLLQNRAPVRLGCHKLIARPQDVHPSQYT